MRPPTGQVIHSAGVTTLHGDGANDDTPAFQALLDGGFLVPADH